MYRSVTRSDAPAVTVGDLGAPLTHSKWRWKDLYPRHSMPYADQARGGLGGQWGGIYGSPMECLGMENQGLPICFLGVGVLTPSQEAKASLTCLETHHKPDSLDCREPARGG